MRDRDGPARGRGTAVVMVTAVAVLSALRVAQCRPCPVAVRVAAVGVVAGDAVGGPRPRPVLRHRQSG